jgi:hypothetical protein
LTCLAGVLAYATFFESWYGTAAVQEWIYQSPWFALLLTFLGTNILCAALIRYPWTKRQTGFVITHAGLLTVLIGSWISFKVTDDGQVGMVEGADSSELVRIEHSTIRVRTLDSDGQEKTEMGLPFHPGSFAWENDRVTASAGAVSGTLHTVANIAVSAFGVVLIAFVAVWVVGGFRKGISPLAGGVTTAALAFLFVISLLARSQHGVRIDTLTEPGEPFDLKVKEYYPASSPLKFAPVRGENGAPMIKAAVLIKPPRAPQEIDVLDDPERDARRWLIAENPRLRRAARNAGPALISFQFVDTQDKVDDFLAVPEHPLTDEVARIHYTDKNGKAHAYEWNLEKETGKTVALPDSDLSVTFRERRSIPLNHEDDPMAGMMRTVGDSEIHTALFDVKKANGPAVEHYGWASLPMIPSVIPSASNPEARELVRIAYYRPPAISQVALQGRSGVIEILGTPDGSLYYRAFGREGLRGKGKVELGKLIRIVSGPNQPISLSLRVDEFLTSGVDHETCEPLVLPKGQMGNGIPACLVEMTVKGDKKEFWIRRSSGLDQEFQDVAFPSGRYRISFDFDRKPLGFDLKLVDFEMGTDPGTQQASSFVSQVLLTDSEKRITNKPVTISMNEPLCHRGYTFYQSNYIPLTDRAGNRTGQFMSIFQVRKDPVWGIIYTGCLMVVLGAFVQFYMRAGIFTDGGAKERARAAAKQLKREKKNAPRSAPAGAKSPPADDTEDEIVDL